MIGCVIRPVPDNHVEPAESWIIVGTTPVNPDMEPSPSSCHVVSSAANASINWPVEKAVVLDAVEIVFRMRVGDGSL
jgi:hypothetical protein